MTPKKCMSIAKSLTNTQHMELEPLWALAKALQFKDSNVFTTFGVHGRSWASNKRPGRIWAQNSSSRLQMQVEMLMLSFVASNK